MQQDFNVSTLIIIKLVSKNTLRNFSYLIKIHSSNIKKDLFKFQNFLTENMETFLPKKVTDLENCPREAFKVDALNVDDVKVCCDDHHELSLEDDDDESGDVHLEDEDVISRDFEKTHTVCAAFTVVSLVLMLVVPRILFEYLP